MPVRRPLDVGRELLEGFEQSARVTEYLVSLIAAPLWRAEPPVGRGRTIGAIAAHMQGVRRTFAKMGGAPGLPPALGRDATRDDTLRALRASREALIALFSGAFDKGQGRIPRLPRRTVNMLLYLLQHDAHHRGQITMLAKALGHEFTTADVMRIWGWKKFP
jgi:uncharacterized damage-inducible protein DinB